MTSISAGSQHPQSLSPPHAKTTIACRGPRRSPTRNTGKEYISTRTPSRISSDMRATISNLCSTQEEWVEPDPLHLLHVSAFLTATNETNAQWREATTGPIGSRSPCSSIPDCRRHEAFESGNPRDAYSSVSHLKGNLDSLCFAIGLREDGGQEGALERLLPMLKIQPRPPGEVRKRGDSPKYLPRKQKVNQLRKSCVLMHACTSLKARYKR